MWKHFKEFFIGNTSVYSVCDENGWEFAVREKITKKLIEDHLNKKITLGSYYIYKKNVECCKWICIDMDLHPIELEDGTVLDNSEKIKHVTFPIREAGKKNFIMNADQLEEIYWAKSGMIIKEYENFRGVLMKNEKYRIEASEFDKLERLSKEIMDFLIKWYGINPNDICRECSGRGYHVWIKLKKFTTLQRAFEFREDIREKLFMFFGIDEEIFPKQKTSGSIGNFVKLPLSYNWKNMKVCKLLDGFDLTKQGDGFEIGDIIKKIRKKKRFERNNDPDNTEMDLTAWAPLNHDDKTFYSKLRPCLKAIVNGKQANGGNGHYIRMAVANELFKLKAPLETRINAFKRQADFDAEISKYQCLDLEIRARRNNRFFVPRCEKIAKRGWCLPDCPYREKARISLDDNVSAKDNNKIGIKGGWHAVREVIRNKLNGEKSREYIIKTTRSGTTTNVILETLENDKKILVIAPTIKICEDTVSIAMKLCSKDVSLFRLGSNRDLCESLFGKTEKIPVLKNFPFLLKDNCRTCVYDEMPSCREHEEHDDECRHCKTLAKNRKKCNWKVALEDITDFDVIYITTAKLHALTKTTDPEAKQILNNIYNHVDVIFLDELSEVLGVGSEGLVFYAEPDPIYKLMPQKINAYDRFKEEFERSRDWIEARLSKNQKKIFHALYDFMKAIRNIHYGMPQLSKNNEFLRLDSPLNALLKKLDEHYIKKGMRNSGNRDWLEVYKTFIEYTENTEDYLRTMTEILMIAKFPQFYMQYTNPARYLLQLEIMPAKPIKEFLEFVNDLSNKKQFFTTDATEPPINVKKLFPNITELIINDPCDTAKLQVVYPDAYNINVSKPAYLEKNMKDVLKYIDMFGNENTMIICQNIYTSRRLRKELKKGKHYRTLTYFRSPLTIGTPSECRTIITVGSPYPPKNSHRWLADLFIKEKIVEEKDIDYLTARLEYYNAKSAFFQSISRGKDPEGKKPSEVYTYGLNKYRVKQLLDFPIAVPRIAEVKTILKTDITIY